MRQLIKRTKYCDLLSQGKAQEGKDIYAVERIYIHKLEREEIRFAWYKLSNGKEQFQPRPLDLTEENLLEILEDGIKQGVFSEDFKKGLKTFL